MPPRPYHRLSAAITSWFRLPDQGMAAYEMLCRGTTFCVKPSKSKQLYFLTCSHIAAPWRWPKLYPLPWLEHVREENVRCVLHVTEPSTGRVLERLEMEEEVTHHEELDACVLTVRDQGRAMALFEKHGLPIVPLEIKDAYIGEGQPLIIPGYGVEKDKPAAAPPSSSSASLSADVELDLTTDAQVRRLSITSAAGTRFHDRRARSFARTEAVLADGVCGGPVLDEESGLCVGMVEGVVPSTIHGMDPESEVHRTIAGSAAVVHSRELMELLEEARARAEF